MAPSAMASLPSIKLSAIIIPPLAFTDHYAQNPIPYPVWPGQRAKQGIKDKLLEKRDRIKNYAVQRREIKIDLVTKHSGKIK
jgi:hypothetical protein